jgi:cell division protein FtsB
MQGVIVRIAVAVFGLLTVAMLLLAVFNDKGSLQVRAQAKKLSALEDDITKLDAENKKLNTEIQALRTDATTVEKLAREELKLVKPGEVVIVTPDN